MATATKIQGKYTGEGNRIRFYDTQNKNATTLVPAGVYWEDHFQNKIVDITNTWTKLVTGAAPPTQLIKADQPGGVIEMLLTAAVEIQLSGIYMADERPFTLNRGLNFEARYRFPTLPANASTVVIGLAGDHNAAIDTVAESIWFRHDFSGLITVETDDTANETSKVTTGVTIIADEWVVVRIDCADPASVKFFVNGNPVATATTFNMNTTPGLQLQPVARLDKAANASNLGVMQIDYIKCWQNLS
jgi:hypothetical protein